MKHYYTNNEDLISEPEQFIFTYRGKELIFTSDHGVFSKKMIDFGYVNIHFANAAVSSSG